MKINEIFASIQGEGRTIGTPAIFIRFAGCSKVPPCPWCDTKYALSEKQGVEMSLEKVHTQLGCLWQGGHSSTVVFTGGEPLFQKNAVMKIIEGLCDSISVIIETHGDHFYPDLLERRLHLVLSPKINHHYNRESFCKWMESWVFGHIQFTESGLEQPLPSSMEAKFVVGGEDDLTRVEELWDYVISMMHEEVFHEFPITLQPLAPCPFDRKQYLTTCRELCVLLLESTTHRRYWQQFSNLRIIPQQHKFLWGDKRGV